MPSVEGTSFDRPGSCGKGTQARRLLALVQHRGWDANRSGQDRQSSPPRHPGRLALIVLAAWALAIIVPSFYQVAAPLASFGLSADNNGRIFDTVSPFANADESPAAAAGLLHGDRLDLGRMRCTNPLSPNCVSLVAVLGGLGGLQYVRPGSRITLSVVPRHGGPTHTVRLAASLAPLSVAARLVLLADTVVGVLFIAVAFHLVWTRPGRMTWGFFLYAIWFNPGQDYAFYALIQPWPLAVLAEQFVEALAQGCCPCWPPRFRAPCPDRGFGVY